MPLEISEVQGQSANVKRLMIGGSLDTETAPELDAKISSLVSESIDLLVLDMKPLDFISSAGLRVIFKATKQMKAKGGQLAVANRQSHITKVFDIVKALPDLQIFRNEDEMDDYLAAMQDKFKSGES